MNTFGASPQLLMSPPACSNKLPADTPLTHWRHDWLRTLGVVADWMTIAVTATGAVLACPRGDRDFRHSVANLVPTPMCSASLVVFLLANDGAYRGEHGPLHIKEAEHPLRAVLQAALLMFLLTLAVNSGIPRGSIAFSLLATSFLLILEKHTLFLVFKALSTRLHPSSPALNRRRHRLIHELALAIHRDQGFEASGRYTSARSQQIYELAKRVFDTTVALGAIVLTSPMWCVVAVLVRLDSEGPALFCQRRIGKHGRPFRMYKFRSMHADAPKYKVSPSDSRDPRITRVGRLLRHCSLDELPQLLNVVKGEMSLVGPRPEMPFLVQQHRADHRERLQVLPGMTGLWQLSSARAARIHENVQYDSYYVRNRSLSMDLAILLYTPVLMMRGI